MNTPDGLTGPVNLGNPVETSVYELAELVVRLSGSASQIHYRPLPQDDPARRRPDISLAAESLGWLPAIPLAVGLTKTIEYFRHHSAVRTYPGQSAVAAQ
jgi:UDP-glucuronate decarboxylase